MNHALPLAALAALLFSADLVAQRGAGGNARNRRPEEITNRVGAYFQDVEGPAATGDEVADLSTIELARTAQSLKQPVVLYLVDSSGDERQRQGFEWQLFRSDELGILLRGYHCGRIDLAKNTSLGATYAKKAPLFVILDVKGKTSEVAMAGYKPSQTSLKKALTKGASGMKPPLTKFTSKYEDLVQDLERLLTKKAQAEKAQRDADNEGKRRQVAKELEKLANEEQKLLELELKLIEAARLPERSDSAKRLGDRRPRRDRGGAAGGGAGGGGGTGRPGGGGGGGD